MQRVFGEKLGFFGLSGLVVCLAATLAPSSALASPGCDAANAGTFNRTAPANMNVFTQVGGTFANGDTIFATVTGTPLGVGVDLLPGPEGILFVNGANASGSRLVTTDGPRTIDITLAGGPSGPAALTFTCTPAGAAGGGASSATEQSNTATNSTTTSIIVENGVVNGIVDGASQEDPGPTALDIEMQETANRLWLEYNGLKERAAELTADIEHFDEDPEGGRITLQGIGTVLALNQTTSLGSGVRRLQERQRRWRASATAELSENARRQTEIENKLKGLPTPTVGPAKDFTPEDPEDLGDGESILFAPLDPFMRAINRYRGFTLNAADTTSGPGPNVTPLSFTRTLDPKTVGWVRAVYTDYEQDDASQQDGSNVLIAVGAHRDFTDNLRLGAFVTAKWGSVKSPVNALDIDTNGYSLGAYGRYRLGEEIDLNVSTRLGITKNDISVSGTTGSYDTRLASFTVGVSGQEQLSDSVWMRPAISLTNTWVNREDYTNSLGTNIGGNTTWSGNLSAGPTIGTSLTPPEGFIRLEPAIGLLATYTYSDQDSQAGSVTTSETDYLSLSLSPQLSMEMENGMSVDLFGSYFGIGADLDGWSVGGTISIPLN